jgi:hypothetical protein
LFFLCISFYFLCINSTSGSRQRPGDSRQQAAVAAVAAAASSKQQAAGTRL